MREPHLLRQRVDAPRGFTSAEVLGESRRLPHFFGNRLEMGSLRACHRLARSLTPLFALSCPLVVLHRFPQQNRSAPSGSSRQNVSVSFERGKSQGHNSKDTRQK